MNEPEGSLERKHTEQVIDWTLAAMGLAMGPALKEQIIRESEALIEKMQAEALAEELIEAMKETNTDGSNSRCI
jgi:hypothetical protein